MPDHDGRTVRQNDLVAFFEEVCGVLEVADNEHFTTGHEVTMRVVGVWPRVVSFAIAEDGRLTWKIHPHPPEVTHG